MEHIHDEPTQYSLSQISEMAVSAIARERITALLVMRKQIGQGISPDIFFPLAHTLVSDANNDCRWQALIVIEEGVKTSPEKVWQVVLEFGASRDTDMRSGIACVLLESLLGFHFAYYFPKVSRLVKRASAEFADMFLGCWKTGQVDEPLNSAKFDRLKIAARKRSARL